METVSPDSVSEQGSVSKPSGNESGKPAANPAVVLADLSELRKIVAPALVTIRQSHGRGTGFVIDGGLVVTAYHVAPLGEKPTVIYDSGEKATVTDWVAYDDLRDIAVLRTNAKGNPVSLALASSLPIKGTPVASFRPGECEIQGTVTEVHESETWGTGAKLEMLCTTLNAVPGWSGGPVVTLHGEVVGLNCRTDGPLFQVHGLKIATGSAAAPATAVIRLLLITNLGEMIQTEPKNAEYRRKRAGL